MKLAAIYNVWDGEELFAGSLASIKDHVDEVIVIYQTVSNFGEEHNPAPAIFDAAKDLKVPLHARQYHPSIGVGTINEICKRNMGLKVAEELGCTHFLFLDCDEFYQDFKKAKQQYLTAGTDGSVCKMYTYFNRPTLRFEEYDNYYVPFIHKLHPSTIAGAPSYPFYVDPTRKVPAYGIVMLIGEPMHHFSYIRKDIERKCRNSSARKNIERSQLLQDYNDPACGPGFYVKDFRQKLIEVPNLFNIQV